VRQAWYAATRRKERTSFQTDAILQEVRRIRREVPGMGTHKLHSELNVFLSRHRIKLGRDRLHLLLKEHGMLAKKKASKVATTESNHPHYKYPNKAKDLKPVRINELWVSDLTAPAARLYSCRSQFCLSVCDYGCFLTEDCGLVTSEDHACAGCAQCIENGLISS
jgi:hypothetical protein